MIEQPVADLPAAVPRRLVVRAVLRASLTATVLVVLYCTLPITGSLDGLAALLLVGWGCWPLPESSAGRSEPPGPAPRW